MSTTERVIRKGRIPCPLPKGIPALKPEPVEKAKMPLPKPVLVPV